MPVDDRARVAAAVARVEHDRHAREVRAPDLVGELGGLQPRRSPPRCARGRPAGGTPGARSAIGILTGKPTGIEWTSVDAAARRDLRGLRVDVLGVDAPGEAHDDRRVERLALAQPVDGIAALLVRRELERVGAASAGGTAAATASRNAGVSSFGGHADDLPVLRLERRDRAAPRGSRDSRWPSPVNHSAIRQRLSGLPVSAATRCSQPCRRRAVLREERLDRDLAVVPDEQPVRHAHELVRAEAPQAAVGGQDRLLRLRVVGQPLDERVEPLARQRPGRAA